MGSAKKREVGHQDFLKIEGHPGFERSQKSGLIRYRRVIKKGEKPVVIYTGKDKITHAKKIVNDQLVEILSSNPARARREARGVKAPLLKDIWFEEMIPARKSKGVGDRTLRVYQVAWDHGIKGFWGDMTTADVTQENIRKWQAWYLKEHPDRVFFNTKKYMTMFLRFLFKTKYVADLLEIDDLDKTIRVTKKSKPVGRVYTDKEIKSLIECCARVSRSEYVRERTRIGILIGRFMGCRKMEFLSSKKRDWKLDEGFAEIWSSKNKKWREVPIPSFLIKEIKGYIPLTGESEYLFPRVQNPERHISGQHFDKYWTRAKKFARIKNWNVKNAARVHDLRHTFATKTAQDQWSPTLASKILDMSISEYEKTYVHLTWEDTRQMMEKSFGTF